MGKLDSTRKVSQRFIIVHRVQHRRFGLMSQTAQLVDERISLNKTPLGQYGLVLHSAALYSIGSGSFLLFTPATKRSTRRALANPAIVRRGYPHLALERLTKGCFRLITEQIRNCRYADLVLQ